MAGSQVSKSYGKRADPVIHYCTNLTVLQSPAEKELQERTLTMHKHAGMLGAPEVLHLGKTYIHLIGAKRCLDIGTFTGASALAWAGTVPDDGEVLTFDVDHSALNEVGAPVFNKHPQLKAKISFHLGPALEKLDELISRGQTGTWDFAFIDADKENYSEYYRRAMALLRPGGVILVDNSLWSGRVAGDPAGFSVDTKAIDECNRCIFNDSASHSILLNLGDGTHVAIKK